MKRNWRSYLSGIIAVAACGLILLIYPLQKAALQPYESNYGKGEVFGTGDITQGTTVAQSFEAERKQLKSTSIYMQNLQEVRAGNLTAVLGKGDKELKRTTIPLEEIDNYEWYPIKWNIWLEEPGIYTISITTDAPDNGTLQIFATLPDNGPVENRGYQYDNKAVENITLAINYQYVRPAEHIGEAIPFIAMVVLAGALLIEIVHTIGGKKHA